MAVKAWMLLAGALLGCRAAEPNIGDPSRILHTGKTYMDVGLQRYLPVPQPPNG